jgi:Recombination endonuclease VII
MSGLIPTKLCPDCGREKPTEAFGRNKRLTDGLARYCKECFQRRSKASYRKRMSERGKQVRERPDVPEGFGYCPRCEEVRPLSAFGSNKANKSGLAAYCRPCHNRVMADNKAKNHGSIRSYFLKRRYGLTEEDVAAMLQGQAGRCLVCLHLQPLPHVDHDHATGEIRGLLCFRCNGALGQFRDDPTVMRRAADYLEEAALRPPVNIAPRGSPTSHRGRHLTKRYGIGEKDVERLIARQDGLCLICRKVAPTAVDHDHVTGAVRGVLCGDCNTGMGQLRDNPWVLRRAIEYLTGGLLGLCRAEDGSYEVTVVRPRRSAEITDPGWNIGQVGGYDLALLHALACEDSGEPWEVDAGVAETEPTELPFPALDLGDPNADGDEPVPAEPSDPAEYAFS